jgi:hypothetical protein
MRAEYGLFRQSGKWWARTVGMGNRVTCWAKSPDDAKNRLVEFLRVCYGLEVKVWIKKNF